MPLVRPSVVLQPILKKGIYSQVIADEIKRSYMHIAQSVPKEAQGDAADGEGNVMRMSIRLHKPYWDGNDAEANSFWNAVMPKWIRNLARNMTTAMITYNNVEHPAGAQDSLVFDWADFEFDRNATIRIKLDARSTITPEAPAIIEAVRDAMARSAFGEGDVALVRAPSKASLEMQREAAAQQAKDTADQETGPGVQGEAEAEAQQDRESSGDEAEQPAERNFEPDFDIDFGIWGIEYADGRVEEFDSRTR